MKHVVTVCLTFLLFTGTSSAENGYRLWLRYDAMPAAKAKTYTPLLRSIYIPDSTATQKIIRQEWTTAITGWFNKMPVLKNQVPFSATIVYTKSSIPGSKPEHTQALNNDEAYRIITIGSKSSRQIYIQANSDKGWLYGSFALLQLIQTGKPIDALQIEASPKIQLRLLNHWDNLDRTVERGYAGQSIWNWHHLPGYEDKRYTDYARANASIGINGTVLTNVNANATILTAPYIQKVKKLADIFRPYGIKVYLTARFSAPVEIGGLKTADPLNEEVIKWWQQKAKEIYKEIPDFGGFLVKANSEGQPGPQNYGRTHADGANMLADAVAPFNGVVMWRAFVYSNELPEDRHKQANLEFEPLDGKFRENVIIQVKNGAIDFQPREPFHPLFGKMPQTPLMLELQITQEYLGQATNLVYLAPMFKECLDTDTHLPAKGNTVAQIIDGSTYKQKRTAIAGVANIGSDINWTGHVMAQSNWYAFGRLAWDHQLSAETIAREWLALSFNTKEIFTNTALSILMESREACVNYMTPLGLHHLMGTGHHYGPAPWVDDLDRADWTPYYYHKATKEGIGFNRTSTGSNAVAQYAPYWQQQWNSANSTDEKLLLWFHHLPWNYKLKNGDDLWTAICTSYDKGVKQVRTFIQQWDSLEKEVDAERFSQVKMLLKIQEEEAKWWRNACLLYFQSKSGLAFPTSIEPPEGSLEYYKSLKFPYAPGN